MGNLNISNRYANALLGLAGDKGQTEGVSSDMELVFNTLTSSRELRVMLSSPVIIQNKKSAILTEIFSGKISSESLDFLLFLVQKDRADLLYDIIKRFLELVDEQRGVTSAKVVSASELTDEQKDKILQKLEGFTGKKIKATFSTDENLLGGFTVRLKDTVIDASLKHQLVKLKSELLKGEIKLN